MLFDINFCDTKNRTRDAVAGVELHVTVTLG